MHTIILHFIYERKKVFALLWAYFVVAIEEEALKSSRV